MQLWTDWQKEAFHGLDFLSNPGDRPFIGWDEKGIPTREKLFFLGLEEAARKMERSR
jgi:hypothetical protein